MDETMEEYNKVEPSSSELEDIKTGLFDDYYIREDPLKSDLPHDDFVRQMEVKSELNDVNNSLTNNQNISENHCTKSVNPQRPHKNATLEANIKSECNIEIKEEILESNSLKENFGGVSETKSKLSEPNSQELRDDDYTGHSQKVPQNHFVMSEFKPEFHFSIEKSELKMPQLIAEALINSPHGGLILSDILKSVSARHPNYKLENKRWQNTLKSALSTNSNFTKTREIEGNKRKNHWTLAKNPSKKFNAKLKKSNIKTAVKVKGVEVHKYVKGKRDLTPINQTTSKSKIYECKSCGVNSKEESDLRRHMCYYELKCSFCGKIFKIESDLQRHQILYHNVQNRKLGQSRKKLNLNYTTIELEEQSEMPISETSIVNPKQQDVIHSLENQPKHKTYSRSCFKYKCIYCDKTFRLESDLKRHMSNFCANNITHNTVLRHAYTEYGNEFETKTGLNHHIDQIHKKQFDIGKSEQIDTRTQIKRENLESDLSEDNFVGLCEIKSESSAKNEEFIENQEVSEIDPLEVQGESNSDMITLHDVNKSIITL